MGRPHGRHDDSIGNDGNEHRRVRPRPAGGRRIGMSGFLPAIVMAAVLAAGGTVAALAASGSAGPSLTVSYQTTTSWGTGYTGLYTITNDGAAATAGWTLGFRLPSGASLSSLWNGTDEVSGGQVTVTNAGWDGTIEPGAAANVGLVVEGSAAAPQDCTIDGAPCEPGGGSTGSPTPSASATVPTPTPTATPSSSPSPSPSSPAPSPSPSQPAGTTAGFAPYVDTSLFPPFSLTSVAASTGVKQFNLAFVVSGGGCTPEWGGTTAIGDNPVAAEISALRAMGGDVRVRRRGRQ
jgi:Cellulose binding domain